LSPNTRARRDAATTPRKIFKGGALIFMSGALLLVSAALAPHTASARAQVQQAQDAQRFRITTASGVRVRSQPDTSANEVAKLPFGAVVRELGQSQEKARVGAAEDFWYMVNAPDGTIGWVFGGLTAPFDAARRAETYQRIADERLANKSASFNELAELVRFLDRATKEKEVTRRDAVASLELARLTALARSLSSIPVDQHDSPVYKQWTTERDKEIVYSEPAGQWFVRADLLWNLQKKYADLPVGERIAWAAAETPLPGECEGDLGCTLYYASATHGQYLKLYPRGPHAAAALSRVAETFKYVTDDMRASDHVYQVPPEEKGDFRKTVATLRAQLGAVSSPKAAALLGQLEEIARHFG
jgi:Bacterial SH3 domain